MIDIVYAEKKFEEYLDQYDRRDDKIQLKIVHTYGVCSCMDQITKRMGLLEEDCLLARLIGLLHDIGRFEQLRRFHSFEPGVMDHAAYGVKVLFEEGMIRNFIKEDRFDDIIKIAILKHSDYELSGIKDERMLLHAKLIRDADKLDNCRVKLDETIETLLDVSAEEVGDCLITPEVLEQVEKKKAVISSTRRTKVDYWISYVAYFFDINFKETMEIILENHYVDRIIRRIPYGNLETARQMREIQSLISEFLEKQIEK